MTYPTKKLGDVIELNYGKGISKYDRKSDGKYPVYGANGVLDYSDKYLIDGDAVIVGRKGSAGEMTKVSGKFWPSDVTYYVLGNNKIDIDYLFHALKNLNLQRLAVGVKPGINRNRVYELEIPLPPIAEQRKIVAKLEKVLGKIKEAKKLRKEAESATAALLPAELHKIFSEGKKKGWEEKLGDIIDFFNGKAHEPFINTDGKFKVINSKFISKDGVIYKRTDSQLSPLLKNDIVMVMSDVPNGKALAKCYLVEKNNVYTLNQRIGCFRVKDTNEIYPQYLLTRLNRNEQLLAHDKGRGQTNLRKNDILDIKIPLPPLTEQKKIVARLDALSAKVQTLRQAQAQIASDLSALEQSVLHQAFNI